METGYYKSFEPFFGSWYIKELLGEGSYGKVYEIEKEDFGQTYKSALKVITIPQNKTEIDSIRSKGMNEASVTSYFEGMVKELIKEFELMAGLKGESHIVSYEDHMVVPHKDEIGWDIFIRMELLTPMNKYLTENKITNLTIAKMASDICQALELCQKQNIIHRDIKPENLFVSNTGNFKLGDFGVARSLENATQMSKKGTYKYMAPEVNMGQNYDSSIDLYSLGLVMYELFNCNREPFLPLPPAQFEYSHTEDAFIKRMKGEPLPKPHKADNEIARVILKACAFKASDRYASPKAMRDELDRYLSTNSNKEYNLFTNTGSINTNNDEPIELPPDPVCPSCGKVVGFTVAQCPYCGETLGGTIGVFGGGSNTHGGETPIDPPIKPQKNKMIALILAIIPYTGWFGVHDFYLGNKKFGKKKLFLNRFFVGWIIDIIQMLTGKYKMEDGSYLK